MNMRILVTGGSGFIGSHLCKKLLSQGHYVICLDNNFTGSMNNILELKTWENVIINHLKSIISQCILTEISINYT